MGNHADRFGVPEGNIRAAEKWAKKEPHSHYHCIVPTRKEVMTMKVEDISRILLGWMCNSPTEIIPSRTQITEVRELLQSRPDAIHLAALITMCNYYIQGE